LCLGLFELRFFRFHDFFDISVLIDGNDELADTLASD
jgi:hypothetical protein